MIESYLGVGLTPSNFVFSKSTINNEGVVCLRRDTPVIYDIKEVYPIVGLYYPGDTAAIVLNTGIVNAGGSDYYAAARSLLVYHHAGGLRPLLLCVAHNSTWVMVEHTRVAPIDYHKLELFINLNLTKPFVETAPSPNYLSWPFAF